MRGKDNGRKMLFDNKEEKNLKEMGLKHLHVTKAYCRTFKNIYI